MTTLIKSIRLPVSVIGQLSLKYHISLEGGIYIFLYMLHTFYRTDSGSQMGYE
jgi:hypothetical protein